MPLAKQGFRVFLLLQQKYRGDLPLLALGMGGLECCEIREDFFVQDIYCCLFGAVHILQAMFGK